MNHVAIAPRIVQPLQYDGPRAFANDEPVARRIKRSANSRRRQRPQLRESHLRVKTIRPRHAPRDHRVALTQPQRVARQLQRIQTRRTRRIQRVRSAAQTQRLRNQRPRQRRRPRVQPMHAPRKSPIARRRPESLEHAPTKSLAQYLARHRGSTSRRQCNRRQDHAHAFAIDRPHPRIAKRLRPRVHRHRINRIKLT